MDVDFGRISVSFLQTHDTTALEELRCRCKLCGKGFKEQRYVTQHMALHKEPHLTCAWCGRRFRWVTSLRNHRTSCYRRMRADQLSATAKPVGDTLQPTHSQP